MKTQKIKYKTMIDRIRDSLCPVCGHPVEDGYGSVEVMARTTTQIASCPSCETNWSERYVLQGIEVIETVDQEIEIEGDLSFLEDTPELLETILNIKEILPLLLGVSKDLDYYIGLKMKED